MNAISKLKEWMEAETALETLRHALPSHITPDRLVRTVLTTVAKDPNLQRCQPRSIYECVITTAQLGLEPGPLGLVYFVPYKDTCTLILGYKGMMELAQRTGLISTIYAECVYEADTFEYARGTYPILRHEPAVFASDRGQMLGVYAYAQMKDGSYQLAVMSRADVDGIRKRSAAGNRGPWVTDYEEMAKKTALRRLCKVLPLSPEFRDAIMRDQADEHPDMHRAPAVEVPAHMQVAPISLADQQPNEAQRSHVTDEEDLTELSANDEDGGPNA